MDTRDRQMLIETMVDRVFTPNLVPRLGAFLEQFKKQVIFEHDYEMATGYKISTREVPVLDLKTPQELLIRALDLALQDNGGVPKNG